MRGKEDMHHKAETLEYLRAMLGQLRGKAEEGRHDMLAYLIEMAYLEVSDILRGERPLRVRDEGNRPAGMPLKAASEV